MSTKGTDKYLKSIAAILQMQQRARGSVLKWQQMVYFLQLKVLDLQHFQKLRKEQVLVFFEPKACSNLCCLENAESCVDGLARDTVALWDSVCACRKCELNLLRYMRSKLRLCTFDLDILSRAEVRCAANIGENEQLLFILGVHCQRNWKLLPQYAPQWFLETWMLQVGVLYNHFMHYDGNIINTISRHIESKSAVLFPVLVSDTGMSNTSMLALGRFEWLALKLMVPVQYLVESNKSRAIQNFWRSLEFVLKSKRWNRQLDIMWSRYKLEFHGENMESITYDSNNPTVVMLYAWPRIEYHGARVSYTTNVAENTASNRPGQMYPETRLLWRDRIVTGELPNLAMQQLAEALHVRKEINVSEDIPPTPEDLPDPSDDENSEEDRESEVTVIGDRDLQWPF